MRNEHELWLDAKQFRPVAFYPYTSGVSNKILSQNYNYKTDCHDFLNTFGNRVKAMIEDLNIHWDNKVVVELQYNPTNLREDIRFKSANIFVGWYDGIWSIGMAMWQDPWLEKRNQNKYFSYPIEVTVKEKKNG